MKTFSYLQYVALVLVVSIVFIACHKELPCETCDANQSPVAEAGADKTIILPTNNVILDARASNDVDDSITIYHWSKIAGPTSYGITDANAALTEMINLVEGHYELVLKVTDSKGLTDTDTLWVHVFASAPVNQPPVAMAGPDKNITLPQNSTTLDGSASSDPENNIVAFEWTKIDGPASFSFSNPLASQTTVNQLEAGVYIFKLQVTDNEGLRDTDTIEVTVHAAAPVNQPPVANAGADQTITLPNTTVVLEGSASYDPENNALAYQWTKIEGPLSGNMITPNAVQNTVLNLSAGIYQFELKVTDNGQLVDRDTVIIKVNVFTSTGNQFIFQNLPWIFPWYNSLEVPLVHNYVPAGVPFVVFVQRDNDTTWIPVTPIINYSPTSVYEYFIETRPDGAGIYNFGSLYIFYYGGDVSDTPAIKIEF